MKIVYFLSRVNAPEKNYLHSVSSNLLYIEDVKFERFLELNQYTVEFDTSRFASGVYQIFDKKVS